MKSRRRNEILRLLRDHEVSSQEQLQVLLGAEGFDVNQGTLSRDLRGLGVVKRPTATGGARYVRTQPMADSELALANLRAFLREVIGSGNLLVIKTRVGGAQPVALALDLLVPQGLVGTIAGDDTVLGIVAEGAGSGQTIEAIWSLIDEGMVNA
jgi:transcriptional regulator of arginine metabolism